jgi:hypothetical protein
VVTPALSLNTSAALVSLLRGRMGFQKRTLTVAAKQRGDGAACGRPTSILLARGSRCDRFPLQLAQDRAPGEARKGKRSPPGPLRRWGASSQARVIGYRSHAVVLGLLTRRKRRPYRKPNERLLSIYWEPGQRPQWACRRLSPRRASAPAPGRSAAEMGGSGAPLRAEGGSAP